MSYDERANARPNLNDESDVEEEAMVNDYREQVNFDDGMSELDRDNIPRWCFPDPRPPGSAGRCRYPAGIPGDSRDQVRQL